MSGSIFFDAGHCRFRLAILAHYDVWAVLVLRLIFLNVMCYERVFV